MKNFARILITCKWLKNIARSIPEDQQSCRRCGRPDKFDFGVKGDIWEEVAGEEFKNTVLCLTCFDDLAAEKKIPYSLFHLTFAGQMGDFSYDGISDKGPDKSKFAEDVEAFKAMLMVRGTIKEAHLEERAKEAERARDCWERTASQAIGGRDFGTTYFRVDRGRGTQE